MKLHLFITFGMVKRAVWFICRLNEKKNVTSVLYLTLSFPTRSCIYSYNLAQELPNGPVHNALKISRCIRGTDRMLAKTEESYKSGRITPGVLLYQRDLRVAEAEGREFRRVSKNSEVKKLKFLEYLPAKKRRSEVL